MFCESHHVSVNTNGPKPVARVWNKALLRPQKMPLFGKKLPHRTVRSAGRKQKAFGWIWSEKWGDIILLFGPGGFELCFTRYCNAYTQPRGHKAVRGHFLQVCSKNQAMLINGRVGGSEQVAEGRSTMNMFCVLQLSALCVLCALYLTPFTGRCYFIELLQSPRKARVIRSDLHESRLAVHQQQVHFGKTAALGNNLRKMCIFLKLSSAVMMLLVVNHR